MQRRTSAVAAVALATICGLLWQAAPASQQAGWQVSDLDTGQVEAPDIAVDTRGNVLAVWSKQQRVFTSTYSIAGGKWTAAIMLSNALDFSSEPQVASNASGAAIAVWRGVRSSDATPYVGLSRFSAGYSS